MSQPIQTRENHTRLDPTFHFFLVPVTAILFIWSLVVHFRQHTVESMFVSIGFFMLLFLCLKMRQYAAKVQDRVIRLEERLRLASLGDNALRARIAELTERQLVALRFASDAEAPALAAKALDEKLDSKQIKALIKNWRPDYFRV